MYKSILTSLLFICLFTSTLSAQNKKVTAAVKKAPVEKKTFIVYGNCSMCEANIENALKDVDGIKIADWDMATDQLTVAYDQKQITLDQIKQKVADVGYDSDTHRAKKSVYKNLPMCCQYDRPEKSN